MKTTPATAGTCGRLSLVRLLAPVLACCLSSLPAALGTTFTPMVPLPAPKPIANTELTGGGLALANFFDGNLKTDFASRDEGTNTVVEMDFEAPTRITAIRHIDRNDPATVAVSEMDFFDAAGKKLTTVRIAHANKRSGETLFLLPEPVTASRAKWRVTQQGNKGLFSLGGAELSFYTSHPNDAEPTRDLAQIRVLPFLSRQGTQPVVLTVEHHYVEPVEVNVQLGSAKLPNAKLKSGSNAFEFELPHVTNATPLVLEVQLEGKTFLRTNVVQQPVRPLTVYVLPHSHTDIGYTEIQTAIEDKQVKNLVDGLAAARRTASYPEGSRFVWNVEVGWAADLYLQRMDQQQRDDFFEAVKSGQVVLNGMYLNELTGLCRPEELVQLFRFATLISEKTGVPVDSAMISDVPGYTWGTVSTMAHAGIKYLSVAPNYFDRIGTILKEWENKPFYWLGPDGKSKVLVWIPFWGYAMSHVYHEMTPKLVGDFYEGLEKRGYPFDIAYVRWAGHGDNAIPDPVICEFIRDWNAKYVWPKFAISGTGQAFRALEERYGDQLPTVRGDWTPYWEDGAGSSALETAQNRQSSDRVTQAATLFAMRGLDYPVAQFEEAWRNVLLYSEHTWGAWCSVSEPERKETREQWAIKKSYADQADEQSRKLLSAALDIGAPHDEKPAGLEVINTLSWARSELAVVSEELSMAGDRVLDEDSKPMLSQRLQSGELVFVAEEVPPFGCKRYSISSGQPQSAAPGVVANGPTLDNGRVRVRLDETTGGIVELSAQGIEGNLVDTAGGETLNDYRYLIGDNVKDLQRNGPVKITTREAGPLVASLIIESSAPGCRRLLREVRLVAGQDHVEIVNLVDKERLQATNYFAKNGKESVNFAFPFNVPEGELLIDLPIGAMRPEVDQMPSACKNWVTVGRWIDVANEDYGVTWVTLDAPLVEVGEVSATLLNSQTNPEVWRKRIDKTQRFYSWAMNNHWGTNYRAYQDGPTIFRFVVRPHRGGTSPAESTRFATGLSHPLTVTRVGKSGSSKQLLKLSSDDVIVTALKPADQGNAWIVRLYGASGKDKTVKLTWGDRNPSAVTLTDTSERPGEKIDNQLSVPGYGLVSLRAEF